MTAILCKNCYGDLDDQPTTRCTICKNLMHEDCRINSKGEHYCDVCYTERSMKKAIDIEFSIPEVIRRTYIETYRSCPHKFLKEVIEGNQSPPNCYTQVGIDLHDLFERGLHDRSYTLESMVEDFSGIWNTDYPSMNLFESEEQKEGMWDRAMSSIATYYELLKTMPMPFTTEETVEYEVGTGMPKVQFTMDAIFEQPDGSLDLIDWKTGQVLVGKQLSRDLQAPLYIYGVQKHFNRHVNSFTFYYLKDNKERTFRHVEGNRYVCSVGKRNYYINLDEAIKEVQGIFAQIKKGNFNIPNDTKSMFFTCKMCHLRKQGICEGADMQIWNNKKIER